MLYISTYSNKALFWHTTLKLIIQAQLCSVSVRSLKATNSRAQSSQSNFSQCGCWCCAICNCTAHG